MSSNAVRVITTAEQIKINNLNRTNTYYNYVNLIWYDIDIYGLLINKTTKNGEGGNKSAMNA